MPIYEYRCESCGHTLDALQKVADAPLTDCPHCEAASLKRLISAPAFRLKGGGWYETDFKSDKERKRNLADRHDGEAKDSKPQEDKHAKGDKTSGAGEKSSSGAGGEKKPAAASDSGAKGAASTTSKGSGTEAA